MGLTVHLRALFLVAVVTNFSLRGAVANLIIASMDLVAIAAGYVTVAMSTCLPVNLVASLMARQAGFLIASLHSRGRLLAEASVNLRGFSAPLVIAMIFALAMAVGTGRCSGISLGTMLGFADRQDTRI